MKQLTSTKIRNYVLWLKNSDSNIYNICEEAQVFNEINIIKISAETEESAVKKYIKSASWINSEAKIINLEKQKIKSKLNKVTALLKCPGLKYDHLAIQMFGYFFELHFLIEEVND